MASSGWDSVLGEMDGWDLEFEKDVVWCTWVMSLGKVTVLFGSGLNCTSRASMKYRTHNRKYLNGRLRLHYVFGS